MDNQHASPNNVSRFPLQTSEKIEIGLIILTGLCLPVTSPWLPEQAGFGWLVLFCAALLLAQSLIRDLSFLLQDRKSRQGRQTRCERCLCLDSIVGIGGIVFGAILMLSHPGPRVEMTKWCWSLSAVVTMAAGFLFRDLVLQLRPFRLRREKNHLAIIVGWKK